MTRCPKHPECCTESKRLLTLACLQEPVQGRPQIIMFLLENLSHLSPLSADQFRLSLLRKAQIVMGMRLSYAPLLITAREALQTVFTNDLQHKVTWLFLFSPPFRPEQVVVEQRSQVM